MKEDADPQEPDLKVGSFSAHVARGVVRDARVRRRVMFVLLAVAVLMVGLGSTVLSEALQPRAHLLLFLLFWGACAWLTVTALLLALYDLLAVRRDGRTERRRLRDEIQTRK